MSTQPVFSTAAQFELKLRAGAQTYTTAFPSDDEWIARNRAVKTFIQRMGSGTQTKTEGYEAADGILFRLICPDAPAIDDYDANVLIGKLTKAEAGAAVPVPEGYQIPVTVVGGIKTLHTLRVPSEREMRLYRRGAFVFVDLRHGRQELKTNPAAIGEFYDKLIVKSEGYEGAVPLVHKAAAIIELTQTVDELDAEDTESFI